MKKYHVATGDGKAYYGVGYESYREAEGVLKISQMHDPQAHITEEEYYFTNADRIRAMSDEELARWLMEADDGGIDIPFCRNKKECWERIENGSFAVDSGCLACMVEWLKQPAEGE